MRIYTRTGDDGSTGLLGAGRVSKNDPRVEAYGTVDELNAALGLARAHDREGGDVPEIAEIQPRLFQLGAELSARDEKALAHMERVSDRDVEQLERWIDAAEAELAPLKSFVLPGGAPLAAQLHVARTICRRAERRVVALAASEELSPVLVRYLNRLADLLFVLARRANARARSPEIEWHGRKS